MFLSAKSDFSFAERTISLNSMFRPNIWFAIASLAEILTNRQPKTNENYVQKG